MASTLTKDPRLSTRNIHKLSKTEVIRPQDSISQVGLKRSFLQIEEDNLSETDDFEAPESKRFKSSVTQPQQRNTTTIENDCSTSQNPIADQTQFIVVTQTDYQVLHQLRELEANDKDVAFCAL